MKKAKLIYNPYSGDKTFKYDLDIYVTNLQKIGYEVHMFSSIECGDIENNLKDVDKDFYDAFIVSGGDGTINIVVNCLMKYGLNHIPIAIIPSGTANDFATFLKLPKEPEEVCKIIGKNNIVEVDVGKCNEKYFINVCAGGLFANISETIDKNLKEALGKIGYYISAIQEVHNFKHFKLKITNSNEVIEDLFDLFLVLNSSGTGSIKKLSPEASISDGLFDFIGFKNVGISNIAGFALKFIKGEYLEHEKVVFFRDNKIIVESEDEIYSDVDGEKADKLPITIQNIHKAIKIFVD